MMASVYLRNAGRSKSRVRRHHAGADHSLSRLPPSCCNGDNAILPAVINLVGVGAVKYRL